MAVCRLCVCSAQDHSVCTLSFLWTLPHIIHVASSPSFSLYVIMFFCCENWKNITFRVGQSKFSQAHESSQKVLRRFVLQGWICGEQNKKAQFYCNEVRWSLGFSQIQFSLWNEMYKNLSEASLLLYEHNTIVLRFQITLSVLQKRLEKLRSFIAAFHKLRAGDLSKTCFGALVSPCTKHVGQWPKASSRLAVDNCLFSYVELLRQLLGWVF